MRAVLLIMIVAIVAIAFAFGTGFVKIRQRGEGAKATLSADGNGVAVKAGHRPGFDVETGSVKVGSNKATIPVPNVSIEKAGTDATVNNGM